MDSLRDNFGALDVENLDGFTSPGIDMQDEEDAIDESPPPAIGTDERRLQVRAYNFWASLLEDRNFPSIKELDPTLLPDFGPNSVLLDFTKGIEDPSIAYIGELLAEECADENGTPERLSQVTPRSLLSRITDHYMQILANQSPIGFEAEYVNNASATILYRGILLPFSSDDQTIDYIYGVINWKEMADAHSADELLLEIDQALEAGSDRPAPQPDLTDWADGPANALPDDNAHESEAVRPSFDLSGLSAYTGDTLELDNELAQGADYDTLVSQPMPQSLADWLAAAREMAQQARSGEERTRTALYEAVGRAWDFAVAATHEPEDFSELLQDAGIAMQERAPMTPVVKLVFGVDYDKTRLTEYAAVLAFAQRNDIAQGTLGTYLQNADGGLKGVVSEERAFRRTLDGKAPRAVRKGPRRAIAKKLRAIAPRDFAALPQTGEEFALVMIRRDENGDVVVLGEVPENAGLIEKAARQLIG